MFQKESGLKTPLLSDLKLNLVDQFSRDISTKLVIYHAGLGGSLFDNYSLFEDLAKAGYLVCSPSFFPFDYLGLAVDGDLNASLEDFDFVFNHIRKRVSQIDELAVIGHSFGAQSAFNIAKHRPIVSKVVSLDSTLDYISNKTIFQNTEIMTVLNDFDSAASLFITATDNSSPFLWKRNKKVSYEWHKIANLDHEDFTSFGPLKKSPNQTYKKETYANLKEKILNFLNRKPQPKSLNAQEIFENHTLKKNNLSKICKDKHSCSVQEIINFLYLKRSSRALFIPKEDEKFLLQLFKKNPLVTYNLALVKKADCDIKSARYYFKKTLQFIRKDDSSGTRKLQQLISKNLRELGE